MSSLCVVRRIPCLLFLLVATLECHVCPAFDDKATDGVLTDTLVPACTNLTIPIPLRYGTVAPFACVLGFAGSVANSRNIHDR